MKGEKRRKENESHGHSLSPFCSSVWLSLLFVFCCPAPFVGVLEAVVGSLWSWEEGDFAFWFCFYNYKLISGIRRRKVLLIRVGL